MFRSGKETIKKKKPKQNVFIHKCPARLTHSVLDVHNSNSRLNNLKVVHVSLIHCCSYIYCTAASTCHIKTTNELSPVKSCLAFGVVGHGDRVSGYNGYDWPSTLADAVVERGVIWPGRRDWGETTRGGNDGFWSFKYDECVIFDLLCVKGIINKRKRNHTGFTVISCSLPR